MDRSLGAPARAAPHVLVILGTPERVLGRQPRRRGTLLATMMRSVALHVAVRVRMAEMNVDVPISAARPSVFLFGVSRGAYKSKAPEETIEQFPGSTTRILLDSTVR